MSWQEIFVYSIFILHAGLFLFWIFIITHKMDYLEKEMKNLKKFLELKNDKVD